MLGHRVKEVRHGDGLIDTQSKKEKTKTLLQEKDRNEENVSVKKKESTSLRFRRDIKHHHDINMMKLPITS